MSLQAKLYMKVEEELRLLYFTILYTLQRRELLLKLLIASLLLLTISAAEE